MRLCAMHDARTLAAVARLSAPPLCEWMAAPLDSPGEPLGCFAPGNLLSPHFAFDAELPGDWIFAWSGTLAESMDEVTPLNWMKGRALLDEACVSLRPQLERHGRRLLLVPHARHVLSDARSTLEWWCQHVLQAPEMTADSRSPEGERAFGLALDPMALFEESMLADAHDHLRSLIGALGPRVDAVILSEHPEQSRLPIDVLRTLIADYLPPETPILVPGAWVEPALRLYFPSPTGGTGGLGGMDDTRERT